jgi:hypothetical protein
VEHVRGAGRFPIELSMEAPSGHATSHGPDSVKDDLAALKKAPYAVTSKFPF